MSPLYLRVIIVIIPGRRRINEEDSSSFLHSLKKDSVVAESIDHKDPKSKVQKRPGREERWELFAKLTAKKVEEGADLSCPADF